MVEVSHMRENTSPLADGSLLVLLSCYYSTSLLLALQACEFLDVRKSLTTSDQRGTLEASGTFVLIRSTTGWDRPLAPPNCRLIWANAGKGELIPANVRF